MLVAAHMDEVGFMIKEIKADGTFRVVELGGWNPLVVSSQRFHLHTRDGRFILSSQVQCHLISYVLVAGLQVFLVFLISSLMLVLPTKKRLMPTCFPR
ncbi:MAG: hypothetical protein ACLS5G_07660 [Streptococcus sp.]